MREHAHEQVVWLEAVMPVSVAASEQRVVLGARAHSHYAARGKLDGEPAARSGRALDLEGRLVPS